MRPAAPNLLPAICHRQSCTSPESVRPRALRRHSNALQSARARFYPGQISRPGGVPGITAHRKGLNSFAGFHAARYGRLPRPTVCRRPWKETNERKPGNDASALAGFVHKCARRSRRDVEPCGNYAYYRYALSSTLFSLHCYAFSSYPVSRWGKRSN